MIIDATTFNVDIKSLPERECFGPLSHWKSFSKYPELFCYVSCCHCQMQMQRKSPPPTLRSMQPAATLWLLALPTLPDGGLITGTACSSSPQVSPACLDTMQDVKLCLSLYWTAMLLFAHSICLHSLILFRRLPHFFCHSAACCPLTLGRSTKKF